MIVIACLSRVDSQPRRCGRSTLLSTPTLSGIGPKRIS